MKLKYQKINCDKLLIILDRFCSIDSLNSPPLKIFKINFKILKNLLHIPVIVLLDEKTPYINKSNIYGQDLANLISSVSLNIEGILNIQHLQLIKMQYDNFYKKQLDLVLLNVLFIELDNNINYDHYEKLSFFLDVYEASKKSTRSINIEKLEQIFKEDDKNLFHKKFDLSVAKHFFPEQRRASKMTADVVENPWLKLYLEDNKNYMSIEKSSKSSKKLKIIHCPICAKEHNFNDDLIEIKDQKILFMCSHKGTQFMKYNRFSISVNYFKSENFDSVNSNILQIFFKHNIQPKVINSVYFISILTNDKINYIPVKNYMKIPSVKEIQIYESKPTLVKFNCPICAKNHLICFNTDEQDYVDVHQIRYLNFSKLFKIQNNKIQFLCNHEGTLYDNYKLFTVKNTKKDFIEKVIFIINNYYGNYLDGKKIVQMRNGKSSYIIDLANFL